MKRATLADLERVTKDLSAVTGLEYFYRPTGGGFYDFGPKVGNDFQSFTSRKIGDLIDFIDAYRRGFGACLDLQRTGPKLRVNLFHLGFQRPTETLLFPVKLTGNTKVIEECASPRNPMDGEKEHVEIEVCGERRYVTVYNIVPPDRPQPNPAAPGQ